MYLSVKTIVITATFLLTAVSLVPVASANASIGNSTPEQGIITSNETFESSIDLFIVPESSGGYGVYEERGSNTFAPGEDIVLYTEPVGFSYKPIVTNGTAQYLINFTADVIISDAEGNVVGGLRDLPAFQIISHHQNKEVSLTITVSQNSPFPEGDYKLMYRIYDKPSGNTYDLAKDITIAASSSPNTSKAGIAS